MTNNIQKLDMAQRIAECLARTSEPKLPTSGGIKRENSEVIGSVPRHLRHLYNLLDEIGDEFDTAFDSIDSIEAEKKFSAMLSQMEMVHSVFFDSLGTHVPVPNNCSGLTLLENWDVVANYHADDEDETGDDFARLIVRVGHH